MRDTLPKGYNSLTPKTLLNSGSATSGYVGYKNQNTK